MSTCYQNNPKYRSSRRDTQTHNDGQCFRRHQTKSAQADSGHVQQRRRRRRRRRGCCEVGVIIDHDTDTEFMNMDIRNDEVKKR